MSKVYFASDFHLGVDAKISSQEREKQIVSWLDQIKVDASKIFLVGDVFDFWFDYKKVIPRGYTRLLGKLSELSDAGIELHFFTGNHDMWMFGYLENEVGLTLHKKSYKTEIDGKKFFVAHGDGLGPGDHGYKFIKKVFANKMCQWIFHRLHPNFGIWLADFWSGRSRVKKYASRVFLGKDEWIAQYCERKLEEEYYDYFIMGHRHLVIDMKLSNDKSRYLNLGDWLYQNSYAVFDGKEIKIDFFENVEGVVNS